MTFALFSDVRETTTAPGTSSFALAGAYDGSYFSFSSRYADGDTGHYYAKGAAGREIGKFTYNSSGNTLTRTIIKSTNSNAAVSFSAGTVDIAVTNIAPGDLSSSQLAELLYASGAVCFSATQSLTAAQKATAQKNVSQSVLSKSANYTAVSDDCGALIVLTGSATLSLTAAATLGNGWCLPIRNNGTGIWTVDPNSTELIDGQSTINIYGGESFDIRCDGTSFYTVGRATGLIRLASIVASSSPSIVFDSSMITSAFDWYVIEMENVVPATNNVGLYLTVSHDNGSSYKSASYIWQRTGAASSSPSAGTWTGSASDSRIKIVDDLLDNTVSNGVSGTIQFSGPSYAGNYKMFRSETSFYTAVSSLGLCQWRVDGLYQGDGLALNNIKLAMSSGNIAQGRFRLYGARKD